MRAQPLRIADAANEAHVATVTVRKQPTYVRRDTHCVRGDRSDSARPPRPHIHRLGVLRRRVAAAAEDLRIYQSRRAQTVQVGPTRYGAADSVRPRELVVAAIVGQVLEQDQVSGLKAAAGTEHADNLREGRRLARGQVEDPVGDDQSGPR